MKLVPRPEGFTLTELLFVVVIFAVVSGYALSSWESWVSSSRHRTLMLSYQETFAFARWMAVSNRKIVTICPLSAAGECMDDWNQAVSVFPDQDKNKKPDDGHVWQILSKPPSIFSVKSRTGGTGYLRFSPEGMIHGATGSLVVCSQNLNSSLMSYLAINKGGRLRIQHDEDGDRIIKLPWGTELTC